MLLLRDSRFPSRQSQYSAGGGESPPEGALLPALIPSDEVTAHQGTTRSLIRGGFIDHVPVSVCAVITWCVFLQEEREMWQRRPCPVPLLKVMALSVIHLQPLRLVLLDTLMTDYIALVDSYLNSSHYEPDELEHVSIVGNFFC